MGDSLNDIRRLAGLPALAEANEMAVDDVQPVDTGDDGILIVLKQRLAGLSGWDSVSALSAFKSVFRSLQIKTQFEMRVAIPNSDMDTPEFTSKTDKAAAHRRSVGNLRAATGMAKAVEWKVGRYTDTHKYYLVVDTSEASDTAGGTALDTFMPGKVGCYTAEL
jgi:hypothetical protein